MHEGDCPAFATVTVDPDAKTKKTKAPTAPSSFPDPQPVVDPERFTVRLSGIGGTGVITVSQIIGTAAMLDGFEVRGLDQTGLSQKAGPVTSDVRITRGAPTPSNHANAAGVDCFLAFDLLAAASDSHREGAVAGRTVVVGSVEVVPTGSMVIHPGELKHPGVGPLRQRLDAVSRPEHNRYIDAASIAKGIFGSTTTANIMTLGAARAGGRTARAGRADRAGDRTERRVGRGEHRGRSGSADSGCSTRTASSRSRGSQRPRSRRSTS